MRAHVRPLTSLLVLAACSSPGGQTEPADSEPGKRAGAPEPDDGNAMQIDYDGPPCSTELERMESHPIQYALNTAIEVPTGGWELVHDVTKTVGDTTSVHCTLTRPGKDEMVIQVLQTLTCRIPLGTQVGDRIALYVRQAERGVEPAAGAYQLARRVPVR